MTYDDDTDTECSISEPNQGQICKVKMIFLSLSRNHCDIVLILLLLKYVSSKIGHVSHQRGCGWAAVFVLRVDELLPEPPALLQESRYEPAAGRGKEGK